VRQTARPIFLVGPRATGKTTVARLLAERLRWGWLDADELLEKRAACSIRELFDTAGEAAFRDLESVVLDELCFCQRLVIATGGGWCCGRPTGSGCVPRAVSCG
jgi:shikimate kinase